MPDTPARPTLLQRVVLWILGALLFYIVALYPNLLMARFQPDDVVHYGFLKWLAVVLVLYWVAARLFFTERPVDTRPGRQTLAVTAAILLFIGIFSPIVSFSFVGDVDFFRSGYGDGYILLLMAASATALAVTGRWKQVIVPALGGLAVILWTFLGVQETISEARSGGSPELAGNPHAGLAPATMASIQWEWGWILLFAGSGLLVYSAARRDEMADAPPPFAAVPVEDEPAAAPDGTATGASASAPAEWTPAEPAAEEPADEIAGDAPEEAAAGAAEPAAEAATEPAAEAPAESAAAEETANAAAAADEMPVPEPETAAVETEPAGAEAPVTAEAQAPATEPEAAEAPAPEADDAAADADTQAESDATPAAATEEVESATAEPAPVAAEATGAAGEAEPASESAGSDAQESEGASSEPDQASAEAAQATPGETAAGSESGASDESESKPASDAKTE